MLKANLVTEMLLDKSACDGVQKLRVWGGVGGRREFPESVHPEYVLDLKFSILLISLSKKFCEGVYCRLQMCGLRPQFVTACSSCVLHLTAEILCYTQMQIHVLISCMFTKCLEYIS